MSSEQPVLSVNDASLAPLWDNLSFNVKPGEIVLIRGANGSGKTSLFNCILGTRRLSSGTISFPVAEAQGRKRPSIGYIPQQDLISTDTPIRGTDLVSLAGGHGILSNRHADPQLVHQTLTRVGANGYADQRMGFLSGGQQQKIRQAQAIITAPELLLCDEPMNNLDPHEREKTIELLQYQAEHYNATILCISHDDLHGIANRTVSVGQSSDSTALSARDHGGDHV